MPFIPSKGFVLWWKIATKAVLFCNNGYSCNPDAMNVPRLCFVVEIPTPDAMNEQRLWKSQPLISWTHKCFVFYDGNFNPWCPGVRVLGPHASSNNINNARVQDSRSISFYILNIFIGGQFHPRCPFKPIANSFAIRSDQHSLYNTFSHTLIVVIGQLELICDIFGGFSRSLYNRSHRSFLNFTFQYEKLPSCLLLPVVVRSRARTNVFTIPHPQPTQS